MMENRDRRCNRVRLKIILTLIIVLVSFNCYGCTSISITREATAEKKESPVISEITEKNNISENEKKVLIVYYSYSGITEDIAENLQKKTGGKLLEIEADKNYINTSDKSTIQDSNVVDVDISSYDLILVGSPAWWKDSVSLPVMSFLSDINFEGKEVAPFCIDQGGGNFLYEFDKQVNNADTLDGLYLSNVGQINKKYIDQQINLWLNEL